MKTGWNITPCPKHRLRPLNTFFFMRHQEARSWISMVPNLFPVLIALGLMGFLDVYMSMPLMIMAPVIIGVAVDDTIHFFTRYRREFNRTGTYEGALKATLSTVGRPIMFTTMTLVAGFSVFGLSDIYTTVHFGLLAAFAFLWALLADFFLAPVMLLLFKPLGAERQLSRQNDRLNSQTVE